MIGLRVPFQHLARRIGPIDARKIDELEVATSVLLAILVAHWIGAENVSWAAFSGYMVMRGHASESFVRGVLRIVGTGVGALLGLMITPVAEHSLLLASVALAVVGGLSLYAAMTAKRSYAWLFVGLTFTMILLDKLEHPSTSLAGFAQTRLLEVMAGTAACVVVSTVSTFTLRRRWPGVRAPAARRIGWHPHAARHATQAAVALLALPALGRLAHVPELAQSSVTILAAMLVPVTGIGASGLVPVGWRLLYRVIGCLAGAALAAAVLFTAHGSAPVLIIGTLLGVVLGRHIENGKSSVAYVGTQFTMAILVTLVPDTYANAQIGPALDRMTGIVIGTALLLPVLIAWHLLAPGTPTTADVQAAEPGGI